MPRHLKRLRTEETEVVATTSFSPPLPSMSFEKPLVRGAAQLSRAFAPRRSEASPTQFLGYSVICPSVPGHATPTTTPSLASDLFADEGVESNVTLHRSKDCALAADGFVGASPRTGIALVYHGATTLSERLRFYVVPSYGRLQAPKPRYRGTATWLRDCVDDVAKHVLHGAQSAYDAQCVAVFAFADEQTTSVLFDPDDGAETLRTDGLPVTDNGRRRTTARGIGGAAAAADGGGATPSSSCRLVGLCVGRELSEARRAMVPTASGADTDGNDSAATAATAQWVQSSTELSEATLHGSTVCGVELVWVAEAARRCGVATALVHVLRKNLVYGGHEVPAHAVAFSQPSRDGKCLAAAFAQRRDFFTF